MGTEGRSVTEVTLWVSMRNSFPAQRAAWEKAKNCTATERGGGNRGDNSSVLVDWKLQEKGVREYAVRGSVT